MITVNSIERKSNQLLQCLQSVAVARFVLCLAIFFAVPGKGTAVTLESGDIVVVDSSAAVLRVEPETGSQTVISSGGNLVRPFGVVIDAKGDAIVTDTGAQAVIRIDPQTGSNTVVSSGGILGAPYGIALDDQGNILVANGQAIIRVDPVTGAQTAVSSNGLFRAPVGVAVGPDGTIFVADLTGAILRVDPNSGEQLSVNAGSNLVNPVGIAIDDSGKLLVADECSHTLVRIDATTGTQEMVSGGGDLVTPVSVAVSAHHDILVGDPDAFNLNGGVIQIDPASETQTNVYVGSGEMVNPRGVAIVPSIRDRIARLCPCNGPTPSRPWRNHREYVRAVAKVARQFVRAGSITNDEKLAIVSGARTSDCGR